MAGYTDPATRVEGRDITVSALAIDLIRFEQGTIPTVTFTVTNHGDTTANVVSQEIWVSANDIIGDSDDISIDRDAAGTLWPGEIDSDEFEPLERTAELDPGEYMLWVVADFAELATEVDETNNLSDTIRFTVIERIAPPELDFSDLTTPVEVYLKSNELRGATFNADTFEEVTIVRGGSGADRLVGDTRDNTLYGNGFSMMMSQS